MRGLAVAEQREISPPGRAQAAFLRDLGFFPFVECSARLVHELWPLEENLHDAIGDPFWWPDGKYLLARCRSGMSGPSIVGIWNVTSGRYRGSLGGCQVLDDPQTQTMLWGTEFYKTCGDGELLRWNVDQAVRQIAAFEKTLSN